MSSSQGSSSQGPNNNPERQPKDLSRTQWLEEKWGGDIHNMMRAHKIPIGYAECYEHAEAFLRDLRWGEQLAWELTQKRIKEEKEIAAMDPSERFMKMDREEMETELAWERMQKRERAGPEEFDKLLKEELMEQRRRKKEEKEDLDEESEKLFDECLQSNKDNFDAESEKLFKECLRANQKKEKENRDKLDEESEKLFNECLQANKKKEKESREKQARKEK